MVTVFRLQNPKHNNNTLSGQGALKLGGRWNAPGTPLIYTSTSISLAILETRVHYQGLPVDLHPPMNIVVLELPEDSVYEFTAYDLPVGWDAVPIEPCSQQFLKSWLQPGNRLACSVPSVINPYERNILINPLHPDITRVVIEQFNPFVFDKRLYNELKSAA